MEGKSRPATVLTHLTLITVVLLSSSSCARVGVGHTRGDGAVYHEEALVHALLDEYVKEARPVQLSSQAVNVSISFSFVRIEDLIESTDTFSATVYIAQTWKDPRLRWNVSDFGGVQQITLPKEKVWTPDIVLYNVAVQGTPEPRYEDTVIVLFDGSLIWVPMMTIYSTCPMDLRNFPYDTQVCTMVFGSWKYSSKDMSVTFVSSNEKEVDVNLSDDDSSYPIHEHPQWDLLDNKAKAKISQKTYPCCSDVYTLISITCRMQRKPQFYRYLTVGPAAVTGLLVPAIFLLPARMKEKTTFGLLLFLCLALMMSILENAIPFNHGSLPHIASFYLGTMILTCFSIFLSIIVTNISATGARRRPLPAWLRTLFLGRLGLRRLLCVGDYFPVDNLYSSALRSDDTFLLEHPQNGDASSGPSTPTEWHLKEMLRCIRFIMGKMAADDSYHNVNQEWEELARVIDRCLFFVFFGFYIFTAVSLLL
ncbi:neuronal acetylcholine receptor subunit alpha-10-like [Pomacea canaliculata]|uniref:neuronal acetylcholine receptor subunit alpha-10-like n=1 Tax=Pomacea canaliculata TaxID=400727 RepID=UPI000D737000|nr:neuronal acetylcholine receptor subunit alpha-10-like [Pomacea canaliculata]